MLSVTNWSCMLLSFVFYKCAGTELPKLNEKHDLWPMIMRWPIRTALESEMLHFCQQSDRLCLCMLRWANKRCKIENNDMTSSQHIGALIFCLQRLMVRCFIALPPPPFSLQPSSPNPILETTHNPHSPNRSNTLFTLSIQLIKPNYHC